MLFTQPPPHVCHLARATRRAASSGTEQGPSSPQPRVSWSLFTVRTTESHCGRGTRAQRGDVTCPRSHSSGRQGWNPALSSSSLRAFVQKSLSPLGPCSPPQRHKLVRGAQGVGGLPSPSPRRGRWALGRSPTKMGTLAEAPRLGGITSGLIPLPSSHISVLLVL